MKKVLFLVSFFLLTAANNWLTGTETPAAVQTAVVLERGYAGTDMPLGDGEEKSGEEDKDFTEDDDEAGLDHHWMSRDKSFNAGLHFQYQEILFSDLEIEVVIPPPKA